MRQWLIEDSWFDQEIDEARARAAEALHLVAERAGPEGFHYAVESQFQRAHLDEAAGLMGLDKLFEEALLEYRLSRCGTVLDASAELPKLTDNGLALVQLMHARLARVSSDYDVAMAHITAAEELDARDWWLGFRVIREAATIYRLAGKHGEAFDRWDALSEGLIDTASSPALTGLVKWGRALTLKDVDRIPEAVTETAEAIDLFAGAPEVADELQRVGVRSEDPAGHLLRLHGRLAYLTGNYTIAAEDFESFCQRHGALNDLAAAYTRVSLGHVLRQEGHLTVAAALAEESLEIFTERGDRRGVNTSNILRGFVALARGDRGEREAVGCFEAILHDGPKVNPYGPLWAHLGFGELYRQRQEWDNARENFRAAHAGGRAIGSRMEAACAGLGLAAVDLEGNAGTDSARTRLCASLQLGEKMGSPWVVTYSNLFLAVACPDRRQRYLDNARGGLESFRRRPGDRRYDEMVVGRAEHRLAIDGTPGKFVLRIP